MVERLFLLAGLVLAFATALPAIADDLPQLQRGDVIFRNSRSAQSLAILGPRTAPIPM